MFIVVEEKVDNDHSKYKLCYGINILYVHTVDWLFEVTFIAKQLLFICLKLFIISHKKMYDLTVKNVEKLLM